jgi:hypothetical protein
MGLRGDDLDDSIPRILDVDAWMRQFALLSLTGIGDTYTQGNPHNINFYVRPGGGLVESMPWDWDFTFSRAATSPLWGGRNFSNVIKRPKFKRVFYGHMLDLIETTYNEDYMTPWLTHLGTRSGESYTGNASYIRSRVRHVTGSRGIPEEFPFEATATAATVDGPSGMIEGKGWFNVKEIRANGEPIAVTWLDDEQWQAAVALQPGENPLAISAIDYQGKEVASAALSITNTSSIASPAKENLVVTELHYHPADGGTEFIELQNISTAATIDLSGAAFTNGVNFTFPPGSQLAPGKFALVVEDVAAFEALYGNTWPVVGAYTGNQLSNGGERVVFSDAGGAPIWDFEYNDRAPWPEAADGDGPSLVLLAPESSPEHADAANWAASSVAGGTPGSEDAGAGDLVDADGDGLAALLERAFGTSDSVPSPEAIPELSLVGDEVHITVRRDTAQAALVIGLERSEDLEIWEPVEPVLLGTVAVDGQAGVVVETWGVGEPLDGGYYRVSASKL